MGKKHEEHENHERWLVSYADFITLLFATFTVWLPHGPIAGWVMRVAPALTGYHDDHHARPARVPVLHVRLVDHRGAVLEVRDGVAARLLVGFDKDKFVESIRERLGEEPDTAVCIHERAAVLAALGPEIDHPVRALDHVEVVLDHDERVAGIGQPLQRPQPLQLKRRPSKRNHSFSAFFSPSRHSTGNNKHAAPRNLPLLKLRPFPL